MVHRRTFLAVKARSAPPLRAATLPAAPLPCADDIVEAAIPLAVSILDRLTSLRDAVIGVRFLPCIASTAALGTLGLITFIASWNNFIGPWVVMRSLDPYMLMPALRRLQSTVNTEWVGLMTDLALATIPLGVLFAASSRRLIAGLTAAAVKQVPP
jgi:hypothetical protein